MRVVVIQNGKKRGYDMDREEALKYIMKRYPDQKEILGNYLQEVKKICPAKYWIMLRMEREKV